MNGDPPTIPQVPVTTLAGTVSLTELLPELPLPTPLVGEQSRSLLFHPRVAEEAQRHLACQDPALVAQLSQALALTSADHIEIKEQFASSPPAQIDLKSSPPLLQGILRCNPAAFAGKGEVVKSRVEARPSTVQDERVQERVPPIPPPVVNHVNNLPPLHPALKGEPRVRLERVVIQPEAFVRPVSNNHKVADIEASDALKEPVIKLVKLSSKEVKNFCHVNSNQRNINQSSGLDSSRNGPNLSSKSRQSRSSRNVKTKYKNLESESESEDEDRKKPAKYFKSREKEREEQKRKDKAERKRNRVYSDDEYDPSEDGKKRRKVDGDDQDTSNSEDDATTHKQSYEKVSPKKIVYNKKRIERKLVGGGEKLTSEELMETGVYQRFTRSVERIFDNTEEIDLTADVDEDGDVPQEYLIPKYELAELCSESAKLKSLGAMALVPTERLVRLLNILEKNIRDGAKVTPIVDEDDDEDDKLWLELVMERILRAMDASLAVLYILTAANMSKRVYLEDVIERCIQFAKFQLNNTIYPSFDVVYRLDNKKDGFIGNIKRKRAHAKDVRDRNIIGLYNKLHELVGLIADLLSIQTLTDTTVLLLSTLGVAPFFVENVPELQLSSLRLVTKVFCKYDKHRKLLLNDILASIARLPNSKRSLRTYRLNSDENIQMLTALVLQLIQCVVELPNELSKSSGNDNSGGSAHNSETSKSEKASDVLTVDRDVLVCQRYEMAMGTAFSFLSVFLQKTASKSEEIDYRPLFENFVQDLLLTVNKPEWPAAELLLSFLGKLLVQKFSNKNTDMSLRVSSLDCLGIVAARLRRDAVTSQLKVDRIDQIIGEIKEEEAKDSPFVEEAPPQNDTTASSAKKNKKKKGSSKPEDDVILDEIPFDPEEERTLFLQRVILDWLAVNAENEKALLHARHFYIGQWYRDAFSEILRQKQGPVSPKSHNKKSTSSHKKRRRRCKGESSEEESESNDDEDDEGETPLDEGLKNEVRSLSERRKRFLLKKVTPFPPASPGARIQSLQTHIDYESAELITRYLASKRSFSQSFDSYLKQILRVLSESAIAVRTKAMKCLTMVVDADPAVLGRNDMQMGVHHSFLDHSTSVREAAVDLVGKFVLSRPELIHKYYDMIGARILDTGVSVRKRVIKILKDICLEYPDFQKIPEICVKMIRRVNDEEGIKKLVQDVFHNMWFTPVRERPHLDTATLLLKVNNIAEVVIACKDTGLDWFEQLLHSMFKPKEDKEDVTKINTEPPKTLVTACKQIVDCLVSHILSIEEKGIRPDAEPPPNKVVLSESNAGFNLQDDKKEKPRSFSQRLIACLKTLYLFAKIRPQLLVDHAITLQPYLSLRCQTHGDYTVIGVVARTLELVVPLMEHPSETFLAQLEEDAVKLILLHDRTVITSCLALLGSIINTVTKNYRLIKDCFNKYYSFITDYKRLHEENASDVNLEKGKPFFRRALYTVGLLLRHFDFNKPEVRCGLQDDITSHVVDTLMYFMDFLDINIRFCTLQSLGSICIRHYQLMMSNRLITLYHRLLLDIQVNVKLRVQTLHNIETYLQEEEIRMIKQDQEWAKTKTKENLKEMCDIQSGMASTIIQVYLKQVLECMVDANVSVRHSALRVIQLVLSQGLVHPVQIVPYLICMSTDSEELVAHSADKQLQDIEKKYPGFINMKAMHGFRLSYRLQILIQEQLPTRGSKQKANEAPGSLNGFLYSIMRGTKQQRRAVAMSLLKQFDEQMRTPLSYLLYISDNLAYFPYQVIDEPMFIIHHIDIMISVTGSNLLQSFRESLMRPPNAEVKVNAETGQPIYDDEDDDDEMDLQAVYDRLPENVDALVECMKASQGCLLMLMLKQHLKEVFGITDNKIWHYSPSDTSKQYEKSATRKSSAKFNPKRTLVHLREDKLTQEDIGEEGKKNLIEEYFSFKELMLKIDREEEVDSDDEASTNHQIADSKTPRSHRLQQQAKKQNDVVLLPGTHDGWEEKPDTNLEDGNPGLQDGHFDPKPPRQEEAQHRSPIKPLTIRASQVTHKERHHRSSHHKSTHKKHKKKKKRKRYSDSEGEDSDYSDPDFLI